MNNSTDRIVAMLDRYRSLARNAAFLFALRAVQQILRLVIVYFVVRALDQDTFGKYQFILSCVALMTVFALPGVNNSIMQSVARGFSGSYRRAVPRALAASLAGSAILAGIGIYYLRNGSDLSAGFFLAAILFPMTYGLEQWRSYRAGKENFPGIFRIDGLSVAALTFFMVAGVTRYPGNLLVPLSALLGVYAVTNLTMTALTLHQIPKDAPSEPGSLRYGARTTIYTAFNTLANQADKILLFTFLSPAALAIFYAAERIPELTKGVVQDFAGVMAPRFAKSEKYTRQLDKVLRRIGLAAGVLVVIAAFTVLPWIVPLLFGNSYDASIPYAQALMCSVAIANIPTLRYRYISSKLDESSSRHINIGMSLVRIAASLILVPLYGILGAVISTFIYRISMAIIVQTIIKKRYMER